MSVVSAFVTASCVFSSSGTSVLVDDKLVVVFTPVPLSANGSCVGALVTIVSMAAGSGTHPTLFSNFVSAKRFFGIG